MNYLKFFILSITILLSKNCMINGNNKEVLQNNTPEHLSYKNQKHRFSFNQCELLYNEIPFQLGLSIDQYIDIFGPYNSSRKGYYSQSFIWKDLEMYLSLSYRNDDSQLIPKEQQIISGVNFLFEDLNTLENEQDEVEIKKPEYPIKKDYILINGMLLKQNTIMKDFVEKEGLKFLDFDEMDKYGYKLLYNECQYPGKNISYWFSTKVDFESKDYGGHLTMTGDAIHGTHEITAFSISLSSNERFGF